MFLEERSKTKSQYLGSKKELTPGPRQEETPGDNEGDEEDKAQEEVRLHQELNHIFHLGN